MLYLKIFANHLELLHILIKTEPFLRDSPAFSANLRVSNPNCRGTPPSPLTKAWADLTKAVAQTSDQWAFGSDFSGNYSFCSKGS